MELDVVQDFQEGPVLFLAGIEEGTYRFFLMGKGLKFLLDLERVLHDERTGDVQEFLAVSMGRADGRGFRNAEIVLEANEDVEFRPRETIDGLPIVADGIQFRVSVLDQRLQKQHSAGGDVLEFVDQDVAIAISVQVFQRLSRLKDHVVEIDFLLAPEVIAIMNIGLFCDLQEEPCSFAFVTPPGLSCSDFGKSLLGIVFGFVKGEECLHKAQERAEGISLGKAGEDFAFPFGSKGLDLDSLFSQTFLQMLEDGSFMKFIGVCFNARCLMIFMEISFPFHGIEIFLRFPFVELRCSSILVDSIMLMVDPFLSQREIGKVLSSCFA